jgi:hypothetical protein
MKLTKNLSKLFFYSWETFFGVVLSMSDGEQTEAEGICLKTGAKELVDIA